MRLPMGTVPPNPMIHSAITRPRFESSRRCCNTVDRDVMTAKYARPTSRMAGSGSARWRTENTARNAANTTSPMRTTRSSRRPASTVPIERAPRRAPTPKDA